MTVTFTSDGTITKAVVDAGPFVGTPTGECVRAAYLASRMRPFEGQPVRVGGWFSVD